MPLYHFHLYDDVVIFDHAGSELDDDASARREAADYLRLAKKQQPGTHHQPLQVTVTNAEGKPLFRVMDEQDGGAVRPAGSP